MVIAAYEGFGRNSTKSPVVNSGTFVFLHAQSCLWSGTSSSTVMDIPENVEA